MKHVVGLIAVVLAMVGLTLGALAQAGVMELERVANERHAADAQRITNLEDRVRAEAETLTALRSDHAREVTRLEDRLIAMEDSAKARDQSYAAVIKALQSEITAMRRERAGVTGAAAERIPGAGAVLYIVNPKSRAPDVVLWRDAERSDRQGIARVPKGVQCTVLEVRELARTQGGMMFKVRTVTGEEGWIPYFCLEFREK